jgi:hypothetical protein
VADDDLGLEAEEVVGVDDHSDRDVAAEEGLAPLAEAVPRPVRDLRAAFALHAPADVVGVQSRLGNGHLEPPLQVGAGLLLAIVAVGERELALLDLDESSAVDAVLREE